MARKIPYMQIRGGSSKGLYFNASDLPSDEDKRNRFLLLAMEGTLEGDSRQIDGLGGATSLTSKVAIIRPSTSPEADLDYLFVQVVVGEGRVSTTQTCGNILAGVPHFALETGLIEPGLEKTTVRVKMMNTGAICEITAQTPGGILAEKGDAAVDGVPGTSAPVICNYLDIEGSSCGSLFPTRKLTDMIDGKEVTCIDNGMPVVLLKASDFKLSGNESVEELETNENLKTEIESIRLQAGRIMNLGDVSNETIPKMCLISSPLKGGIVNTRMFIPKRVHEAIGVLAAVSVATACVYQGTVANEIAEISSNESLFKLEHPTGAMTIQLQIEDDNKEPKIRSAGIIRTARILSKGEVYLP
ncbi:4-oxalomesaconate tautomerase [Jiulongibacter sediminis]|uniref:4-oxalomesaconate tautomerase n=1 Tax=Jiulongibacter sediminis TaxID=1605367 RepID=UPI0026EFE4CC|nr:4-oxalomesaconate tautomerase [Jiulongibacter sediminis]